jgi:hypothetical protein
MTPALATAMLEQLGVPAGEGRAFEALESQGFQLQAEAPLPPPKIVIPRFEEEQGAPEASGAAAGTVSLPSAPQLSEAELAEVVAEVGRAGERVRELKVSGAGKEDIGAAVEALVGLKARLPHDHALNLKPAKKKKAQKAPAV